MDPGFSGRIPAQPSKRPPNTLDLTHPQLLTEGFGPRLPLVKARDENLLRQSRQQRAHTRVEACEPSSLPHKH